MKILQIGCGGIGSFLIQEIVECIEQGQIDAFTQLHIADQDIAEIDQIKYQNFKQDEVGQNKAKALAKRYHEYCLPIPKRITGENQLKNYDIIVLCVDNEKTREMVVKYCHKNSTEFIDLRATGRRIFAMPKGKHLEDNLKFIDNKDMKEYCCLVNADLEKGQIQKGNKIVATLGVQMLLNIIRGHNNKTISMVV